MNTGRGVSPRIAVRPSEPESEELKLYQMTSNGFTRIQIISNGARQPHIISQWFKEKTKEFNRSRVISNT